LTMGSLIAVTILANKVFQPMAQIPGLFVQWAKAKVAVEDLDALYKLSLDNENVDRPITKKLTTCNLQCSDLKFSYNGELVALNVPKLQIQAGEKVAILGTIGAGKSTLLKVLSGVYKPSVGRVLIDGLDMQQISRDSLTSSIGYLDQDTKLFAGTMRDNLTLGLLNITDEEIIEFAKITGLLELISSLSKGLDTAIPEGGQSVSGGQRQLIALTRVLIGNSKVLLLDEPTASMDEGTEKRLLNVLHQNITKEQTLIVVTHKPRLLDLVDRIIILNAEGIVADGKKEVVLKQIQDATNKLNKS
jgi:ATP-binding cassette subfamily C protein LapB